MGIEHWWRARRFSDHTWSNLMQEELELGLPHRMQLDLYENWTVNGHQRAMHQDFAVELRFAFADWGRIPLNPALYAEYKFVTEAADVFELKLLLGEQLAPRWHWGFNAVFEKEIGDERATEWQATQGVAYSVIDEVLSVGAEMKFTYETAHGSRGEPEHKFQVGPSVQVRTSRHTHLDLVALFGTTDESPTWESFVIFGIDFGGKSASHYAPAASRSN